MTVETNDETMGKNIYYLRNKKRLSRKKFAQMVGISENMLFCIEREMLRKIDSQALLDICKLFDVSVEDLVGKDLRKK